jgi:nucleotide-binding universal stress UspA family protein
MSPSETPERILVATDFSAGAVCAADAAIALAVRWGAEVDWLHVTEEAPHGLTPSSDALLTQWVDHQHREARQGLDALEQQAREQGIESTTHLQSGRPDVAVQRCVEETGADLVVVGTHGRSGIRSILIGSTAEKIVRGSPTSVLCARPGIPITSGGVIVYGEDLGSPEQRARAAALAGSLSSRIVAVHGVELAPAVMADTSFSPPPALLESSVSEARERMKEYIAEYGPDAETVVCLGRASDALCDQALRRNASLIITGTASRKGIERWMLGSVAEQTLRHAPCSVLVLK